MSEKLATVERIRFVEKHNNADTLDVVQVKNYKCITKRDLYKVNDLAVFVLPDSILPDKPWATIYRAKSNRVKSIKLRGVWSQGIVESFWSLQLPPNDYKEGDDLTELLGVTKFEPVLPQELNAKGILPYGIPKTDQENFRSLDVIPFGQSVDVTIKKDGQSFSAYCKLNEDGTVSTGVCGRTLEYKLDSINNYTRIAEKHQILNKLETFCRKNNVSICLRGEITGNGIQKSSVNPDCDGELKLWLFSTYLIDEHRYAYRGDKYYIFNIAKELDLPTVLLLEKGSELTNSLIRVYDEDLEKIDGKNFEGVVVVGKDFSFKIINKYFDSKK